MNVLKSQSSHWRATCNLPKPPIYQDYLRAKFSDFDIMTFLGLEFVKRSNSSIFASTLLPTQWLNFGSRRRPTFSTPIALSQVVPSNQTQAELQVKTTSGIMVLSTANSDAHRVQNLLHSIGSGVICSCFNIFKGKNTKT